MTSFKRFGSKPVVKYAYIAFSADRQRHNLFWLLYSNKYCICPIRIEIIHGARAWIVYWFYHRLALYDDILPLAIAHGKIFGIKGQPVVKSVYIQAPMNYFLNDNFITNHKFTCWCNIIIIIIFFFFTYFEKENIFYFHWT